MKQLYILLIRLAGATLLLMILAQDRGFAQSCTPLGDQSAYGTNDTWIGYVYQGMSFNTYKGYVNEGSSGNPDFDESFGGSQTTYSTYGCDIKTDTFSVRYKLTKTFTDGDYDFVVGGDDGYRLSLDGGATWVIDKWNDQSYITTLYSVHLSGTCNLVLEYYERFGDNRVSFKVSSGCIGNGDPSVYGTNGVWRGYLYQGADFDTYKGYVSEGSSSDPSFDENFGGTYTATTYYTSNCSIQTQYFSARYRLTMTLTPATYNIKVGGDDGYRLSLDGGNTWAIDQWKDQSYASTTYTVNLGGSYNMVLEYYQKGGDNRISFSIANTSGAALPVKLISWSAVAKNTGTVQLSWTSSDAANFDHYVVQRSTDGRNFTDIQTVTDRSNRSGEQSYNYMDSYNAGGTLYYRLAMVDGDGTINYSSIISTSLKNASETRVYPSVVGNGILYIEPGQQINGGKVQLFDMSGRMLLSQNCNLLSGRQEVRLQSGAAGLRTGSYIVRVLGNSGVQAQQIIFVK